MTWVVELTMLTYAPMTADDFERLDAEAEARGWILGPDPGHGMRVNAYVDMIGDPQEALRQVRHDVDKWLDNRGISTSLRGLRVMTEEAYEAEAMRPDTPELLAATDVAALLGVSRQRVHQLHSDHPDFPAPYQQLGSGPIWTRPAIEHFAETWQRKPGRPTRRAS
ncbi:MAG: hypothetical protein J2P32_08615 [Actinobacteria bacterium]|nr:hypothetical protein [Actinomycetota bacterium]